MIRVAVLGAFALTLAACGPSSETKSESSAPATTTTAAAPAAAARSPEEIAAAVAALPAPYNEADYAAGQRLFAQCRSCHTVEEGAPNRVGPNLHGIFGREIGTVEGFNYSPAVTEANFTWDAAQLDHWLANPREFLPGNRMAFVGVRDDVQRRDLIAYLLVETE